MRRWYPKVVAAVFLGTVAVVACSTPATRTGLLGTSTGDAGKLTDAASTSDGASADGSVADGSALCDATGCDGGPSGDAATDARVGDGGVAGIGGSAVQCTGDALPFPSKACADCAFQKCSTALQGAVGSDPNTFGGACSALAQCGCDCKAGDTTCQTYCDVYKTDACNSSLNSAFFCIALSCQSVCQPSDAGGPEGGPSLDGAWGSSDGGFDAALDGNLMPYFDAAPVDANTPMGPYCARLDACCNTVSDAMLKAECQGAVATRNEGLCNSVFDAAKDASAACL